MNSATPQPGYLASPSPIYADCFYSLEGRPLFTINQRVKLTLPEIATASPIVQGLCYLVTQDYVFLVDIDHPQTEAPIMVPTTALHQAYAADPNAIQVLPATAEDTKWTLLVQRDGTLTALTVDKAPQAHIYDTAWQAWQAADNLWDDGLICMVCRLSTAKALLTSFGGRIPTTLEAAEPAFSTRTNFTTSSGRPRLR